MPLVSCYFGGPQLRLHLVLSPLFRVTSHTVSFNQKSDGTSSFPGKIIHAAGQTEPQASSRVTMKLGLTMDGRETEDRAGKKVWNKKSTHTPAHTHAHTVSDNALGVDSTFTASKARLCDLKVKKRAVLNPQDFQNVNEQINFLGGGGKTPDTSIFRSSKSPGNCLKMRILVLMLMPLK